MNKKNSLFIILLALSSYSFAQTTKVEPAKTLFATRLDSASYAMGSSIAQDLKSRSITQLNYALFIQGMEDVFKGINLSLNSQEGQQAIIACFNEAKQQAAEPLITEAKNFMEANKKKKGVVTTASGLQYEILKATKAIQPKATDEVTVHYKGTLANGKQFDSSYDRNEPLKLALNQVIPAWTEGVPLMPLGSKYRFYVPYELGYGEKGAGADIPPYSVLIFEIELLKIGN